MKKAVLTDKLTNNDLFVINAESYSLHFATMGQIRDSKLLRKIALTIKELREEKGVSQEEVYNDINITSEELKRHEQM